MVFRIERSTKELLHSPAEASGLKPNLDTPRKPNLDAPRKPNLDDPLKPNLDAPRKPNNRGDGTSKVKDSKSPNDGGDGKSNNKETGKSPNDLGADKRPKKFDETQLRPQDIHDSSNGTKLARGLAEKFNPDSKETPKELIDIINRLREKSLSSAPVPKPFYDSLLKVVNLALQGKEAPLEDAPVEKAPLQDPLLEKSPAENAPLLDPLPKAKITALDSPEGIRASWMEIKGEEDALQWYLSYTQRHNIDSSKIIDSAQQYLTAKKELLPTPTEMGSAWAPFPLSKTTSDKTPLDRIDSGLTLFGPRTSYSGKTLFDDRKDSFPFFESAPDGLHTIHESLESNTNDQARGNTTTREAINNYASKTTTQDAILAAIGLPILADRITKGEKNLAIAEKFSNNADTSEITVDKGKGKTEIPSTISDTNPQISDMDKIQIEKQRDKTGESYERLENARRNLSDLIRKSPELKNTINGAGILKSTFGRDIRQARKELKKIPELEKLETILTDITVKAKEKEVKGKAFRYMSEGKKEDQKYYTEYLSAHKQKLEEMKQIFKQIVQGDNTVVNDFKFDQMHSADATDAVANHEAGFTKLREFVRNKFLLKVFDGLATHPWFGEPVMYQGMALAVIISNHRIGINEGATLQDREGGYGALGVVYLVNTAIHAIKGIAAYKLQGRYEGVLQQFKYSFTEKQFSETKQLPDDQQWIIYRGADFLKKQKSEFKVDYDKAWNRYKALSKPSEGEEQEGILLPADNLSKSELASHQQLKEILFYRMMKYYRGTKPFKRAMELVVTSLAFGAGAEAYAAMGVGAAAGPYAAAALVHVAIADARRYKHDMRGRFKRSIEKDNADVSKVMVRITSDSDTKQSIEAAKQRIIANYGSRISISDGTINNVKIDEIKILTDKPEDQPYYDAINRALNSTEKDVQAISRQLAISRKLPEQRVKDYVNEHFDDYRKKEQQKLATDQVRKRLSIFNLKSRFDPYTDGETQAKIDFCARASDELIRKFLYSSDTTDALHEPGKSLNIHVLEAVSAKKAYKRLTANEFNYTDALGIVHQPEEVMEAYIRYRAAIAVMIDSGLSNPAKMMRENIRMATTAINNITVSKNTGNSKPTTKIVSHLPASLIGELKGGIGGPL